VIPVLPKDPIGPMVVSVFICPRDIMLLAAIKSACGTQPARVKGVVPAVDCVSAVKISLLPHVITAL
jgi:hypothetical protein